MWVEWLLTLLTLLTGFIVLSQRRRKATSPQPWWVDYSRSFFPLLLFVLIFRTFVFEPYRIPSGSLEPTLNIGDFIVVNKYHYGLRLPILHTLVFPNHTPQRGDILVFRWPSNPHVTFIKRVIGVPGDTLQYIDKQVIINGKKIKQTPVGYGFNQDSQGNEWPVQQWKETIGGVMHSIYRRSEVPAYDFHAIHVPKDHYFVMVDNRDDSADSRYWGFVPEKKYCRTGSLDMV